MAILFRASGLGALMSDPRSKKDKEAGGLSGTAKTFVKDLWLLNEIGFYESIKNKYVTKGLACEEESITLLSKVSEKFYIKNEERKSNGVITGECDLLGDNEVIDIKTSWNAKTFMNAEMSTLYEYQLRAYMELWDVGNATLAYCLVDAPETLILNEQQRIFYKYNNIDEDYHTNETMLREYERETAQVKKNLFVSDRVPEKDRVKLFHIKRDSDKTSELYNRIDNAIKYYKTLTLNG